MRGKREGREVREGEDGGREKEVELAPSSLPPLVLLETTVKADLVSDPTSCDSTLDLRAIRFCCFHVLLELLEEGAESVLLPGELNGLIAD